jgi:hypothetical protein
MKSKYRYLDPHEIAHNICPEYIKKEKERTKQTIVQLWDKIEELARTEDCPYKNDCSYKFCPFYYTDEQFIPKQLKLY